MRPLLLLLTVLISVVALPARAMVPVAEGLIWKWGEGVERTWVIENEVQLPAYIWVMAEFNKEARLLAFATRMVVTCKEGRPYSKRATEVDCRIDDFAMKGAAVEGDRGLLLPILDEVDTRLTGATLQVILRHDGRVTNIALHGTPKSNRRVNLMQETMRLILSRAIVGFDLHLPKNGAAPDGVWAEFGGMLMSAPTDRGSQGSAETAHLVERVDGDLAVIESAGRGMIVPAEDGSVHRNFFDTRLEAVAVFDLKQGMLRERVWSAFGTPTASSTITVGGAGIQYLQSGKIRALDPGAPRPDLGPNIEVLPPDPSVDSAIHSWAPLSGTPR